MSYITTTFLCGLIFYFFYRLKVLERKVSTIGKQRTFILESTDFWTVTLMVNTLDCTYTIHVRKHEYGVPDDIAIYRYRFGGENLLSILIDDYEADTSTNRRYYNVIDKVVLEEEIKERNKHFSRTTERHIQDWKRATTWQVLEGKIRDSILSIYVRPTAKTST